MSRALLVLLFCWPSLLWAGERYVGEQTLWQDTVWEGRVTVDGILTVAPGVTLEIRPGSEVLFTFHDSNGDGIGEHELFVQGRLLALGRDGAPIRFAAAGPLKRPGAWGALNLMASEEESRLEQVEIADAYRGFHGHFARAVLRDCLWRGCLRGVQFQESQVTLERCRFLDNRNGLQFRDSQVTLREVTVRGGYWGVRGVQSRVEIVGGRVEGNLVNGINLRASQFRIAGCRIAGNRRGLYLQQSTGAARGNRIEGNSEHGILLEQTGGEVFDNLVADNGRSGIKWVAADAQLRGNLLLNNGEYALSNDGPGPVAADGNWWGTTDGEALSRLVRDGADLPGRGRVAVAPPLATAPPAPVLPDAADRL